MDKVSFDMSKTVIWAGGGPMPDELKHATRILTVKEWIKKKKGTREYVVYASTPISSITVNRPYNF